MPSTSDSDERIKCPHCDKMCKGDRGTKIHISKAHPAIHIQRVADSYQGPRNEDETNTFTSQDTSALREVRQSLQTYDVELEGLLTAETISQSKCDVVVENIIKILVDAKEKLPGPKHPATKYYEAR